MVSAQPGLIPQMSECLTNLCVIAATVFADHFSDHVYVYLMKDLTLSETLLAKHAYERFLASVGANQKRIMQTMVASQTKVLGMIALPVIRRLPFVALGVTIKMV
jgi:hypothetical protein